jgi:hypothetical protein
MFTSTDPGLQLNQLETVQRDVAALLEHGLNPPPVAPATAAGEESPADGAGEAADPAAPKAGD